MTTIRLPTVPGSDGVAHYLGEIWNFPFLGREEERLLAERWRDRGDSNAAHLLVTSHLRLVAKIALKYRNYGLPVADLISEGNIGLMKAVKKFDPDRKFRLSTYAMWWIKAAVVEHILQSWSMVKLGTVASQKKLFFSLRRSKSRLNILDNGDLTFDQAHRISEITGAPANDVMHMNRRLSARDFSLNAPLTHEEDSGEFQDILIDEKPSQETLFEDRQEKELRCRMLRDAIAALPERQREIFSARRLHESRPTLEELGVHYGISRERVRQIDAQAFERVKKIITSPEPIDKVEKSAKDGGFG